MNEYQKATIEELKKLAKKQEAELQELQERIYQLTTESYELKYRLELLLLSTEQ